MPTSKDQAYLLNDHYKSAVNLTARIGLHDRFSTNSYGWHPWVFDHLILPPRSRLLELGCGPGQLWVQNLHRVPRDWEITLSDFSEGMVREAERHLREAPGSFRFEVIDAQALPFAEETFDAVIANHMLYHVPDRARAYAEIRRVLRPSGHVYASTIGQDHMGELNTLARRVVPHVTLIGDVDFTLENGGQELARWFSTVELHSYDDALVITEAAPLIAFVLSTRAKAAFVGETLAQLTQVIEQEISAHGAIHVTKATGLFAARR